MRHDAAQGRLGGSSWAYFGFALEQEAFSFLRSELLQHLVPEGRLADPFLVSPGEDLHLFGCGVVAGQDRVKSILLHPGWRQDGDGEA